MILPENKQNCRIINNYMYTHENKKQNIIKIVLFERYEKLKFISNVSRVSFNSRLVVNLKNHLLS